MPDLPKTPEDAAHKTLPPRRDAAFETQSPDHFVTLPTGFTPAPPQTPIVPSSPNPIPASPQARPQTELQAAKPLADTDSHNLDLADSEILDQNGSSVSSPIGNYTLPKPRNMAGNTQLPGDNPADYATVAPSLPSFSPLDPPTDVFGSKSSVHGPGFDSEIRTPGIGRFRILREHARGGLGKVFVAEDLELDREVAYKEIQNKFADDHETQVRFLREAKITGGLEHPGIVPIYGLGMHENGRPYYAMRFIRGHSFQYAIDIYHHPSESMPDPAERQVEFRQLLRRFIDVCNALEYAHAQGIMHRDLKPGNIMLGEYGETLVVDWGLAKSYLSPDEEFARSGSGIAVADETLSSSTPRARLARLSGDESLQTLVGTAVGTPQFMSPEQALGEETEVGPASDIYSLGATLYYMLTGGGAFAGKDVDELMQNVVRGKFLPPKAVNPQVPNALNAICLKAMAWQAQQRYVSAKAIATDIEHWLADEPVAAYQESGREQLNRWVRKHQARAQAIGILIVGIALVSTVAAVLIDQSRRAEARALENLEVANESLVQAKRESLRRTRQTREAIDTSLSGMSDSLETFPGMQDARRRLLVKAASDYQKLAEEKSDDPELQAEAARVLVRLADVRIKLNELEQAAAEYTKAAGIFRQLSAQFPDEPDYLFELARTFVQQGVAMGIQGQFSSAASQFREALEILTKLVDEHPGKADYVDGLATALIGSGRAKSAGGDISGAEQQLTNGLRLFTQLRKEFPKDLRIAAAFTESNSAMSLFLLDRGRPNDAIKLLEDSLKLQDQILTEHPEQVIFHANRATARINLAEALRSLGRWPSVARNYEAAVDDYQDLVRDQPDVPLYRENLAVARTNFGQSLRRLGDNVAAIPVLEKAFESFSELGASFRMARYVESAGNTRVSLALAQSELGKQAEAKTLIEEALADYDDLLKLEPNFLPYQERSSIALSNQARILARQGDFSGALPKFEAAIKILQEAAEKGSETPRYRDNLALAWMHLANVAYAANQLDRSKSAFQESIEVRRQLLAAVPKSAQYQDSLAWLLATCPITELRNIPQALKLAVQATDSVSESPQFQLTLAAAQFQHERPDQALESLKASRRLLGQDDGLTLYLKALCEAKLKQLDNATRTLSTARAWRTTRKPADEELARWEKLAEQALEPQTK
ncbi:MAG: pknD 2 [Planctomycetaceae bacterium]|nr:pknD 2 [Planctomycetaceae bacterium]